MQEGQAPLPIMDNNVGKELSAASFSGWICTTLVSKSGGYVFGAL